MLNLISEALKKSSEGNENKTNEKIMSLGSGQEQRLSKTFVGANRRAAPGLRQIVPKSRQRI